jgi:acyl-ACP thioesterase
MPVYRTRFRVRVYEAGPGGLAGPPILANYLQESAAAHADRLEVGAEPLLAEGLAWILTRIKLRIARLPALGEEVAVETWPASLDKRFALRAWRLTDASGAPLADAIAHWAVFDVARRRLAPLPAWLCGKVPTGPQAPLAFARRSLPAPAGAQREMRLTPRQVELDVNGHVNNAHLLGWLLEPLTDLDRTLVEVDAAFRSECRAGETAVSRAACDGGDLWRHALTRESDVADLVRAESRWAVNSPAS